MKTAYKIAAALNGAIMLIYYFSNNLDRAIFFAVLAIGCELVAEIRDIKGEER